MTITTRNPANPNLFHANKFQLSFARQPNIQYFCQSVVVPGISIGDIPKSNPFVEIYSPGDKAIYDVLNITFLVDEDLLAWIEVHDWMRAMTFPENYSEYRNLNTIARPTIREGFSQFSEATLTLLTSANQPNYVFKFHDVFPIAISSFALSTTYSPDSIVTADATFRYAWYDIEKLN
jgi:hypothetical protein